MTAPVTNSLPVTPAGFSFSGPALTSDQREVLAAALSDAIAYRDPWGACEDCEGADSGMCDTHAADVLLAVSYEELAAELGLEITS